MSERYFSTYLAQSDRFIADFSKDLDLPSDEVYLDAVYQNIYTESFKKVEALYSSGVEISSLSNPIHFCLEALFNYKEQPEASKIFFIKTVDEYMHVLTLLTWGLALDIDQSIFDRLVRYIDAEGQPDALVDLLIAVRQPQRPLSHTLYFPKLYTKLYQAGQNRSGQQVVSFLETWYKTCLGKTASYNLHTLHGGDDSGFTGYWAWEVAGLTLALGLDDSLYRHLPYYPADLVASTR